MESSRVALVTGAARRVGRAIALKLAGGGFDVAITYRGSADEAGEVVELVKRSGQKGSAIQADFSDPQRAAEQVEKAFSAQFNRLDALVNNASMYEPSSLQGASEKQMHDLFAVHFQTPFLLCRRFEKLLRASRGHIVNMIDLLAERPWPEYLVYCASKAALGSLTRGLARALAPEVTVNGIAPGVVEWPEGYPESEREKYLKRVPLGRPGTPEDVAKLVEFLVMDGSYVTGQIIPLDGGRSIT
ncbi:MAG TPA: SDR family oxidoreductase [Tepidisphaeraceae bacterium]|jgi:pteridine reductase|nr:SDR family oxidoreductase [Tepidisphaeraceae bacterium]